MELEKKCTILVAISNFGCKDSLYRYLKFEPEVKLWVPDAFTPDNDGINDIFMAKGTNIINSDFSMTIYDRWGEIIFESDKIEIGWDGSVKGQDYAKPGVYTYLISFKDIYNISNERAGKVSVIW